MFGFSFAFFQAKPESIPYKLALENHKTLLSSTESRETLARQVCTRHAHYVRRWSSQV